MKSNSKINFINIWMLLIAAFTILMSGYSFARVNTKQIEKEADRKVSAYYAETFKYSADKTGVITVEGETNTLYDKLRIGDLIAQVENVSGINNKIAVITQRTADGMIKANIENELQTNNVILEPEKIIVKVNNGVANISGKVSYFREKLMAQSIASWQDGVTDMTSNLIVLSPAAARSDDNLKEIINDILNNHFSLEVNVKFGVNKGIVNLYGLVNSIYAKDHIQEEIQHVIGVKEVVNEINLANNIYN